MPPSTAHVEPEVRPEALAVEALADRCTPDELATLHILRRVSLESVQGLLEHCPIRTLERGETLLEAGQTNQTMFMLLSGRLSVHLDAQETAPVAFVERGQTVGEISVLDDSPVSAFVIAAQTTRLLAVDEDTFWRLTGASHEFAVNLLLLLAHRMRANNHAISAGDRLRRSLEREAMVDALTSLNNRRWLDARLPRLLRRYAFSGDPVSVAMVDVDHFKRFNDDYGHAAGDEVLVAVARAINSTLRPTDYAARYGGEEFVVILPDTDPDGAVVAAERLREVVARTAVVVGDGRKLPPVTLSLGVAGMTEGEESTSLLARADAALYRAKHRGRNRVER